MYPPGHCSHATSALGVHAASTYVPDGQVEQLEHVFSRVMYLPFGQLTHVPSEKPEHESSFKYSSAGHETQLSQTVSAADEQAVLVYLPVEQFEQAAQVADEALRRYLPSGQESQTASAMVVQVPGWRYFPIWHVVH